MQGGGGVAAGWDLVEVFDFFSGGGVKSEGMGRILTDCEVKKPAVRRWFTMQKVKHRTRGILGIRTVFWWIFWAVIWLTIFSGLIVPKKEVFRISSSISANYIILNYIFSTGNIFSTTFGILFSKIWEIWIQGSRAMRHVASTTYFSKVFEG
jgi:hypothetical protein